MMDDGSIAGAAVAADLEPSRIARVGRVGVKGARARLCVVWSRDLTARLPHVVTRHEDAMPTRLIVSKPSEKDLRVIADMAINL